jgi:hypothetical protein
MKAKRLRGVVTLEMSEEELDQLVVDLKCALWEVTGVHKKYGDVEIEQDWAAMGKAKDVLDELIG